MTEPPRPLHTGGDYIAGDKIIHQQAGGDIVAGDKITHIAPPPEGVAALHQLPAPPADFTGRASELAALRAALTGPGAAPLYALRGPGGVGKTALALVLAQELAAHYPDAQLYVDLQGNTDQAPLAPSDVLGQFIRAFAPTAPLPTTLAERQAQFRSLLAGRRVLILFDNARDRAQLEPLLPPAGCLALITSRQHFRLPGLAATNLDSLPRADAVTLLTRLCPRLGDQADAIAALCGDLPLALRLAGGALAERENLTPADYARRLGDKQRLFKELGEVDTALAVSAALLSPELRAAWLALAAFPADFNWLAAAAVWTGAWEPADEDATQDTLSDLRRFSLLEYDAVTKRYRLHDLARAWAAAQADPAALRLAGERHAFHFGRVLQAANTQFRYGGARLLNALQLFDADAANILAGQAWAAAHWEASPALTELCSAYPRYGLHLLGLRLHPLTLITWTEAALAAARRLNNPLSEAVSLGTLGTLYSNLSQLRRAIDFFEQQLALVRQLHERQGEAAALNNLGLAYNYLGDRPRAIELYEQALVVARELNDHSQQVALLTNLGLAHAQLGDRPRAAALYEQSLALTQALGDRPGEANNLGNLGLLYVHAGEAARALPYFDGQLTIARAIGDRRAEGRALAGLGLAHADLAEHDRALPLYAEALTIFQATGARREEGNTAWDWARALHALGRRAEAVAHAQTALLIYEQIEHPSLALVRQTLAEWQA